MPAGVRSLAAFVALILASTCGAGGEQATIDTQPTTPTASLVTTAPSTVGDATTTPAPNGLGLVLRHEGLAVVTFGQSVDAVMAVLSGLLGPPDSEEVQISPDVDRTVQWDKPFLHLQFTHWDHFDASARPSPAPEGPIFHYYLTTSNRFATEAGVSPGSTVAELRAVYPSVVFHASCGGDLPRDFVVDPPSGWPRLPLFGLVDGDVENPETRIAHVGAGWDRSPC